MEVVQLAKRRKKEINCLAKSGVIVCQRLGSQTGGDLSEVTSSPKVYDGVLLSGQWRYVNEFYICGYLFMALASRTIRFRTNDIRGSCVVVLFFFTY